MVKLGYVITYVDDVLDCLLFYKNAFGLEIKMQYEVEGAVEYGEMQTDGAILGFASHALGDMNLKGNYQKLTIKDKPIGQEIVFVVEDIEGCYQRAVSAGAISLAEPTQKPWGQTVAYVRAKEGTLIEICTPIAEN